MGGVAFVVTVGSVPGEVKDVAVIGKDDGQPTVADAMEAAGIEAPDDADIRVNNQPAKLDAAIQKGDIVLVIGEVSGNKL